MSNLWQNLPLHYQGSFCFSFKPLKNKTKVIELTNECVFVKFSSERLLRGISYVSSDEEDAWIVNDDDMEDFIVDQEEYFWSLD